jgi:molybdopterin/thiamine biosynthesis adenylyltransferase
MEKIKELIESTAALNNEYLPLILRISKEADRAALDSLLASGKIYFVHDEIDGQLREIIKCKYPAQRIRPDQYPELIASHLNGCNKDEYGVWIYYPWSMTLLHTLDEEEFVAVRTNRNQYKITQEEQQILGSKKIGVIGLSVGQSIALTLATERTCGEIRLADFDELELSNLNRIRAGIKSLGLSKVVIAAREIAEIDPYLKVKVYGAGIHKDNIDDFFTKDGTLDLVVEVCDGLDIKIESRFKARALGIPVVMDTNDRGMLDVERFDLEPGRPILHGLAQDLDPDNIKSLTNEEKIPHILKMIGVESLSTRMKASMMEVEQSINTWPQLASSVVLGGALTTDVSRRIFLDQYRDSGRYYIDFDTLIPNAPAGIAVAEGKKNLHRPLTDELLFQAAATYISGKAEPAVICSKEEMNSIVAAAIAAPSAGNNQPWKFLQKEGYLFVFHDRHRTWSWGDYDGMGALIALGASLENIHIQATQLMLKDSVDLFPVEGCPELVAAISFAALEQGTGDILAGELAPYLYERHTNRKLGQRQQLPDTFYTELNNIVDSFPGIKLRMITGEEDIASLGEIIAECDRIRLLNKQGHEEFYEEVRWTKEEAELTRDGIELKSADPTAAELAGFAVGKDWEAMALLAKWNAGSALKKMSVKTVKSASAMLLVTIPAMQHDELIRTGRAVERLWIHAARRKVTFHPMMSPVFFFNKMIHTDTTGFKDTDLLKLKAARERFVALFTKNGEAYNNDNEVFLFKVAIADETEVKSLRRNISEVFINS